MTTNWCANRRWGVCGSLSRGTVMASARWLGGLNCLWWGAVVLRECWGVKGGNAVLCVFWLGFRYVSKKFMVPRWGWVCILVLFFSLYIVLG